MIRTGADGHPQNRDEDEPKNMKKGGQNDPSTKTPRPAPPKRIVPSTRTTPTTNDNSNDLINTIIAAEVIDLY